MGAGAVSLDCSGCHPELHGSCQCKQTTGCHAHTVERFLTLEERHAKLHPDLYLKASAA